MKFNWGTGIVIAFICFMSFILFFVIKMNTNTKYEHDLVTEDYYNQELKLQSDINKEENAQSLSKNVTWKKTPEGLNITFPENLNINDISGNVFLYRPSNKTLDFDTPITLSSHNLLIPSSKLLEGRWNMSIDWKHQDKSYLYKKQITY